MFIPRVKCVITRASTQMDVFGRPSGSQTINAKCSIVKLLSQSERSSVRADASGSKGRSREIVADARLLFPLSAVIELNDKIEVAGFALRVVGVYPRFNVHGQQDHWQVDANIWASE